MSDSRFRRALGRCTLTSVRCFILKYSVPTIKLQFKNSFAWAKTLLWQQMQKETLLVEALLLTQYSECHSQPRSVKDKVKNEYEPG